VTFPLIPAPLRTVFLWQTAATLAIAIVAGAWSGWNGAWSALLGGGVSVAAGVAFALILGLSLGDGRPAGVARPLVAMMKAEAGKLIVIVAGLVLVLKTYGEIVHAAFFAAFAVAVIVFGMAILVKEPGGQVHG
jgi:F0F1-type ATP synthase assembly protein I